MFNRWFCLIVCLCAALAVAAPMAGQEDDAACTTVVMQALEKADTICIDTARNQICYGNRLIDVELMPEAEAEFENPGDLTALTSVSQLHTAPLNINTGDWGIALMKVQADLPDTLPGQNITILLIGDVTLTDASAEAGTAPMQAFYLSTGVGKSACENAPNNLVIQSPRGTHTTLTINGADIVMGSTAVFEITPDNAMDVLLVGGGGEVTAAGASENVPAGQMTRVALDENGLAAGTPDAPTVYDPTRIQHVPLQLLPETITVPATFPWTDTGISLKAGQQFIISASGMVTTCVVGDCMGYDIWVSPIGMPTGDACPARVEGAEGVELCRCQGSRGECVMHMEPLMALAGRIGDGPPFMIGSSNTFTAQHSGSLYLSVNDDDFSDNAGAFTAIVTVIEESGEAVEPAHSGLVECVVSAANAVNLRAGPGTNHGVAGQMGPGTSRRATGQAAGSDGFTWWQLADHTWVRSDVVTASNACNGLPVVNTP